MLRSLFMLSLLASTVSFAQTQSVVPGTTTTQYRFVPLEGVCPVGMTVQQQGWGAVAWTVSQEDARVPRSEAAARSGKSGVNVALKAPEGKSLSRVELVVYYLQPRGRVLPVPVRGADAGTMPESKKTFELFAEGGSAREISGSLLVGATAGITRVQLMSVRYSDGSLWSGSGCSVKPSLYMPVAAR